MTIREIEITLDRLKYKLEYFGDEIGSSEYHNLLMEVGRLEVEWNRLMEEEIETMDKSTKQYQVWFEDISGGQPSAVASYDSLDGALRQMYSFYLQYASTYTMFPRLQISEPNLIQFQEFYFRNETGDFGGIFWIVFPGASPEANQRVR